MFDRNYIREVVKKVINETVTFSQDVMPNNDRFITGDAIERKIWYVYHKVNNNGEMYKSPLVTTFPRKEEDEYMCSIRFTSDKISIDEAMIKDFANRFLNELKSVLNFSVIKDFYIKDKEFEREVAGKKGMISLKTISFSILVKADFKHKKEVDILQHTPDAKADRERRMREKFRKAEQALFGPKQTSSSNHAPKA